MYCVPTLQFDRDINEIHTQFQDFRINDGWFEVRDFQIKQYFERVINPRFNRELNVLYRMCPLTLPIPAAHERLIS
jgi:hypothetical protein